MNAESLAAILKEKSPEENKEKEQYWKDIDTRNKESEYEYMSVFVTYLPAYTKKGHIPNYNINWTIFQTMYKTSHTCVIKIII
jgi:hypothetical protein